MFQAVLQRYLLSALVHGSETTQDVSLATTGNPTISQSVFRWMMEQVAAHKLSRKIYGLACYYFDLYLQKLKEKENDPLQAIAMVCLILASKLDNRTFLKFTCPQIPLASIFELELRVIIKLNYRLNPETYM